MSTDRTTVERAVEWASLDVDLGGIASALQAEGLKLPAGASVWNSAAVKGILEAAGVAITENRMGAGEPVEENELDWPEGHCGTGFIPDLP